MSIGERLGYLSVVETLRPVTAVAVPAPLATDEKYRVISPEIMQEAPMSDSEEEGGTVSCLFKLFAILIRTIQFTGRPNSLRRSCIVY